jgi:hypothetical protein
MSDRPTTEMPHVGMECFGTGQFKQSSTKRTGPAMRRKKRRSVIQSVPLLFSEARFLACLARSRSLFFSAGFYGRVGTFRILRLWG